MSEKDRILGWLDKPIANREEYNAIYEFCKDIRAISSGSNNFFIYKGLSKIAEIVGFAIDKVFDYTEECDKISFSYRGYRFFELIGKEDRCKVGDTVRIKADLQGIDFVCRYMLDHAGKEATVTEIVGGHLPYFLDIDEGKFGWNNDMFDFGDKSKTEENK